MSPPRAPLIAAIKRHSLEDGPGIRTVVFLKGCGLRCSFCQNPETRDPRGEIGFVPERCLRCGRCERACLNGAASASARRIDRARCDRCGRCADACPTGALHVLGRPYTPEQLVESLLRDRPFWRHSGGGVTLSGGECLLYPHYLEIVLRALSAQGVHVAIQTGGWFDYDRCVARVWPHVRLVQFDVKLADTHAHRKHCGRGNERIVANLRRLLAEPDLEVQPRVPLIPGVTDVPGNLESIAAILVDAGAKHLTLLPYNPLCVSAAARVGLPQPALPTTFRTRRQDEAALERVRQAVATLRRARGETGRLHEGEAVVRFDDSRRVSPRAQGGA